MAKILLDYVFPITVIEPTQAASTAFLKQVALVCKPKAGQEGSVGQMFECTSTIAVAEKTDNTNAARLFEAGMSKVFILLMDDLDLAAVLEENTGEFYTVLISDDFDQDDIEPTAASLVKADLTFTAKDAGVLGNEISIEFLDTGTAGAEVVTVTAKKISVAMDSTTSTNTQCRAAVIASEDAMELLASVGIASGQDAVAVTAFAEDFLDGGDGFNKTGFEGVVGVALDDAEDCDAFATVKNQVAFLTKSANGADNMCYAFGSILSNRVNWLNQQFIEMPLNDDVDELGEAESLFDDKVSFVISDEEFGNRLALFAAGGKAIVAPYIMKNLRIDVQSRALQWIASNQPQYTLTEASLLETRLQEDVINAYIARRWIESGTVSISLREQNFVATGEFEIPQPKALWRVFSEMRETV